MATKNYNIGRIVNESSTRYAIEDVTELPTIINPKVIYRINVDGIYKYYNYTDKWYELLTNYSNVNIETGTKVTLTMISPQLQTFAYGADATIMYNFESDGADSGVVSYYVNASLKNSQTINTGEISIDLKEYLRTGTNAVRVVVTDKVGKSAELLFTIEIVSLVISSSFDDTKIYTSSVPIDFKVSGETTKTSHVRINNMEYPAYDITSKQNERRVTFSNLGHGIFKIELYATATINGKDITSNVLTYNLIHSTEDSILISSKFNTSEVSEGELISIDYIVHDPSNTETTIGLYINDELQRNVTVDNTKHYWNTTSYPIGDVVFKIQAGDVYKEFNVHVSEFVDNVKPIELGLQLELTPEDKDNDDPTTRAVWESMGVIGTLTGFNWNTNGWMNEQGKRPYLRVNGVASVNIPFEAFNSDITAFGKTIEFEFATKNVYDINKTLITCTTADRGFTIYPTKCTLATKLKTIETKFKDEEILKVSFVIQSSSSDRLIKTYINGILSGLDKYSTNDEFTHDGTININGDIDIYSIRIYDRDLNNTEIVNNYISDLTPAEKTLKKVRNDIYSNDVVNYAKVKNLIPTIIVTGILPLTKGDKRTVSVEYYNPEDPNYNFTFTDVIWDIQGTSSVAYPRKNWKGDFPKAFAFTENAIAESVYTFKADFMESSHSHNTGNAKLVNKFAPKFPTQENNPNVRNAINGFPILMFHRETEDSELVYQGIYNFNNDKGNSATLGLTTEKAESWEFKNNTSARCLFKSSDFTSGVENDLEARYPKNNKNYDALKRLWTWVVSTADGSPESLATFKSEFEQYFNLDACLFYYIMMDIMLATDSRAKNMFLDTVDGEIWYPRWYDIDTTYGLDNEGHNKFAPTYEQTDKFGSGYVYNGRESVLWNNFGVAFEDEIAAYYINLRKNGMTYENILEVLQTSQIDKLSESMYNTDAEFKYIQPVQEGTETYIYVAQGSRLNHLHWWLYNRLSYLDSKYEYTTFENDFISLRAYTPEGSAALPDIEITQSIDGYCKIKYGSYITRHRLTANTPTVIEAPIDFDPNDTETFIYGASKILDLGDLSHLYAGTMDFTNAVKLTHLRIGAGGEYVNENLTSLTVAKSPMLKYIDARGCPNLTGELDLSICPNIEEVYTTGTGLTYIKFADGGNIKTLTLPRTIKEVTLKNQAAIRTFTIESYESLQKLHIENCPTINTKVLLNAAANKLVSAYVDNINWDIQEIEISVLEKLIGFDLHGVVYINSLIGRSRLERIREGLPNLDIVVDDANVIEDYTVTFYNYDNSILQQISVLEGETATYTRATPSKPDGDYSYTFWRWDKTLTNVTSDLDVYPEFLYNKPTTFTLEIPEDAIDISVNMSGSTTEGLTVTVDWGDNTVDTYTKLQNVYHTYVAGGVYYMSITISNYDNKVKPRISCPQYAVGDVYFQDIVYDVYIYKSNIMSCRFPKCLVDIDTCKYNSNLNTIYLPKYLKQISISGFQDTDNITSIYYDGTIEDWLNIDVQYDNSYSNTTYLTTIPMKKAVHFYLLDQGAYHEVTEFIIPETITRLGESRPDPMYPTAYRLQKLGVTGMQYLENIVIPNSVTYIGSDIFEYCGGRISIPDSVTNLSNYAFQNTYATYVKLPNTLTTLYGTSYAGFFSDAIYLEEVVLPNNLVEIGANAFKYCKKLKTINIPDSVTAIGANAFADCESINNIIIPEGPTILDNTFVRCKSLTNIQLPDSAIELNGTFSSCSALTTIIIPDNVTTLNGTFSNCKALTDVHMPNSITSFGSGTYGSFQNCTALTNVYFNGTVDDWINMGLGFNDNNPMRYATHIYINGVEPTSITIDTNIHSGCFTNWQSLTEVTITENVTSIESVFFNCISLTSLTLPNSITSVPHALIHDCNNIHTVTLGTNVTDVNSYAFDYCTGIRNIVLNTSTPPTVPNNTLYLEVSKSSVTLTVPKGALTAYQEATAWKNFTIVEAE